MTTIVYSCELTVMTCWCGMAHAVPTELQQYQQRRHNNGEKPPDIYCPLGHAHVPAGPGAAEVERRRREQAETRARAIADQLAAEHRSHAATKGQLTKTRKRVAAGICPCCHRSFVQLARHMATKHPGFGADEVDEAQR
jgi:hypothetical protein